MGLTPDEAAQLAALNAKAAEPDEPASAEPVVEAAGEVAADVGAAVAEAVGTAAAVTAAAVADATDDDGGVVVVDTPSPIELAQADAIREQAHADAQVQIIEAEADATVQVMEAQREGGADDDADGNIFDEAIGPIVEELEPDAPPKPTHRWFRQFGG